MDDQRIRVSVACIACRRSRRRCSGERPICVSCSERGEQCEYTTPRKRGPPPKIVSSNHGPASGTTKSLPPSSSSSVRPTKPIRKFRHPNESFPNNYTNMNETSTSPLSDSVAISTEFIIDGPPSKQPRKVQLEEPLFLPSSVLPLSQHHLPLHPNAKLTDSPNIIATTLYTSYPVPKPLPPSLLGNNTVHSNISSSNLSDILLPSSPRALSYPPKSPALVPALPPSSFLAKSQFISPKSTPNTNWFIVPPASNSFLDLSKIAESPNHTSITSSNSSSMLNKKTVSSLNLPPPSAILVRDESNVSGSGNLWSPDLEF